jgi:hypothetical protein
VVTKILVGRIVATWLQEDIGLIAQIPAFIFWLISFIVHTIAMTRLW